MKYSIAIEEQSGDVKTKNISMREETYFITSSSVHYIYYLVWALSVCVQFNIHTGCLALPKIHLLRRI